MKAINTSHPGRDATCETTPWHIWHDAVFAIAEVSVADGNQYATRERIQRAYQAGEPAWMTANMIQFVVTVGKREDRADGEVRAMRAMIRQSLAGGK